MVSVNNYVLVFAGFPENFQVENLPTNLPIKYSIQNRCKQKAAQ